MPMGASQHVLALFSHKGATMDTQTIINAGLGLIVGMIGWFAHVLWTAVNKLRDDLHDVEVQLPSYYLRKDEFNSAMTTLNEKLDKIWAKLADKVDR